MDAIECIRSLHLVKSFIDKPVEWDILVRILECGQRALSAANLYPFRFLVITNKEIIRALPRHCLNQEGMYAPLLVVVAAELERPERFFGLRGKRLYAVQDSAYATSNIMLAATAMGLSVNLVRAFDEFRIVEMFGMGENVRPQAIIAMGYSNEKPEPRELIDLTHITYFNRYDSKIKRPHMVMRDYAVEVHRVRDEAKAKAKDHLKKLHERFKESLQKSKEKK
ncbi:nitroreductase family protein [Candidatus Woesearchaeota archaeon]|nr:nitroreductase family protein [Candidatus Woesearchaeota archaeon]